MTRTQKPVQILVYQDPLCAWSYVAEARIEVLRQEFGESVRWLRRPYPLRVPDAIPSEKDREGFLRELRRAQLEPEGKRLVGEVWTSEDAPRSSLPALCALEAARLQGRDPHEQLFRTLQRAALEQGVNISRTDVLFELASKLELDMNRFTAAFQSPETKRLITEEHSLATSRGVKGAPTLVIGGKWMLSGVRELCEYREQILDCMAKVDRARFKMSEHTLH